ncbi:MAG TPA: AAA family ATPase [Mycobacteriales bacterium]|nr:AAA family ATPase [Mycobacteriales bacterium]
MITSLGIRNLKRFLSVELEFRPLTVLTGLNGTGKSTAIHALLLARQAAENPDASVVQLNGPALGEFWRSLFRLEDVGEHGFFDLARLAFPRLVFHSELSFRRFVGAYPDLRDRVVTILAGLCDHFADEYATSSGVPRDIEVAMGRHRVDLSLESPKTRASQRLMRLRDVTHDGRVFRCEWHAKLERHRNRIHFAAPSEHLGGRILVGIFDKHRDT